MKSLLENALWWTGSLERKWETHTTKVIEGPGEAKGISTLLPHIDSFRVRVNHRLDSSSKQSLQHNSDRVLPVYVLTSPLHVGVTL